MSDPFDDFINLLSAVEKACRGGELPPQRQLAGRLSVEVMDGKRLCLEATANASLRGLVLNAAEAGLNLLRLPRDAEPRSIVHCVESLNMAKHLLLGAWKAVGFSAADPPATESQPSAPTAAYCLLLDRKARWEGEPVKLQKRLWDLLEHLLTHQRYPLQQGVIEDAVWGGREITSKTFANTISRLNTALAAISFPWTWRVSAGEVFRD